MKRLMWLRVVVVAVTAAESWTAQAKQGPSESIAWQECPCEAALGTEAVVSVPAGFRFADADGARKFLELTQNPTNGSERGVVIRKDADARWFAVFEFNDTGYVSDQEKDVLDASAILERLRKGNARGNELRRQRGWSEVELRGWHQPPYYDSVTSNLTWSTKVGAPGSPNSWVNHSVRLLGRRGTMDVDLVAGASEIDAALPHFNQVIRGFSYVAGQRYAEFTKGDKVAAYGLTALIAGGAGAAAAKSGLLGKLGKSLVYIVLGVLAVLKGIWSTVFGKRETTPAPASIPLTSNDDSGSRA